MLLRNGFIILLGIAALFSCKSTPSISSNTAAYILSIDTFATHINSIYSKDPLSNLHIGSYFNNYVSGNSIKIGEDLKDHLIKKYGAIKFHDEKKIEVSNPPYNVLILSKLKNNTLEIGWSNGHKHFESFIIHLDKKGNNWKVVEIEHGAYR